MLQYCAILFLILCGATIYGMRTDNWLAAADMAEVLFCLVTILMPVAYLRVRNLLKAYSDSLGSFGAEVIIDGGADSPAVSRFGDVGQATDMP